MRKCRQIPKLTERQLRNFWTKVARLGPGDCWEWGGALDTSGYGLVHLDSVLYKAHRVAYSVGKASQPGASYVCHSCDNPRCCNPSHLWLGTARDNAHDRDEKERQYAAQGEDHYRSILTTKQVIEIKTTLKNWEWGMGSALAKKYGVHEATISAIKQGRIWSHTHA